MHWLILINTTKIHDWSNNAEKLFYSKNYKYVQPGDTIFIYQPSPKKRITYQTIVDSTNIPRSNLSDKTDLIIGRLNALEEENLEYMSLRFIRKIDSDFLTCSFLRYRGINLSLRGAKLLNGKHLEFIDQVNDGVYANLRLDEFGNWMLKNRHIEESIVKQYQIEFQKIREITTKNKKSHLDQIYITNSKDLRRISKYVYLGSNRFTQDITVVENRRLVLNEYIAYNQFSFETYTGKVLKTKFELWLANYKSKDEKHLSPKTRNSYTSVIYRTINSFENLKIEYESLFNIPNLEEFLKVKAIIFEQLDFDDADKRFNGEISSVLPIFEGFMASI